ncbi:MAG TPA: hypothetical protein DD409_06825 [Bacteroidales bacterium]|nr:hypothetical protein [Bacteroidales bacterium]
MIKQGIFLLMLCCLVGFSSCGRECYDAYLNYKLVNQTNDFVGMEIDPDMSQDTTILYTEAGDSAAFLRQHIQVERFMGANYLRLYSFTDTTSLFIYNNKLREKYEQYRYNLYGENYVLTAEDSLLLSCYCDSNLLEGNVFHSWETFTITDTLKTLFTKDTSMLRRFKAIYQ